MNNYFAKMDTSFLKLTKSSVFSGTKLSPAEARFIRELKKNIAIYSFTRVNSKGKIVSIVERSKDVVRPDSSVEKEKWFQAIKKDMNDWYTVKKDTDRGRYYLIWAKPISKKGTFTGAVVAKIDLWDSFYEFSNGVYYPFLIRLNGLSLFSHKWESSYTFKENLLTIPGINKITVRYIPEKEPASAKKDSSSTVTQVKADSAKTGTDSVLQTNVLKSDSAKITKTSIGKNEEKRNKSLLIILIVVFIISISIITSIIISKRRKAKFLRELDEE